MCSSDLFGRYVAQRILHNVTTDRARIATVFRTSAGISLRPQSVNHKTNTSAGAALARIFFSPGLIAEIGSVRERQQVIRKIACAAGTSARFTTALRLAGRREAGTNQ